MKEKILFGMAFVVLSILGTLAMAVFDPYVDMSALADDNYSKTAAITAQNTFTSAIGIKDHGTIRISGTFVATVSLQRSEDEGSNWYDTGDTWTAAGVFPITDYTKRLYRVGVKTGDFTNGTVNIEIGSAR